MFVLLCALSMIQPTMEDKKKTTAQKCLAERFRAYKARLAAMQLFAGNSL
jgi:hypothetical protein